jgi:hypothetical protein
MHALKNWVYVLMDAFELMDAFGTHLSFFGRQHIR